MKSLNFKRMAMKGIKQPSHLFELLFLIFSRLDIASDF